MIKFRIIWPKHLTFLPLSAVPRTHGQSPRPNHRIQPHMLNWTTWEHKSEPRPAQPGLLFWSLCRGTVLASVQASYGWYHAACLVFTGMDSGPAHGGVIGGLD